VIFSKSFYAENNDTIFEKFFRKLMNKIQREILKIEENFLAKLNLSQFNTLCAKKLFMLKIKTSLPFHNQKNFVVQQRF